jgi:hypothetical protein
LVPLQPSQYLVAWRVLNVACGMGKGASVIRPLCLAVGVAGPGTPARGLAAPHADSPPSPPLWQACLSRLSIWVHFSSASWGTGTVEA